jgi:hypothetical protein
MVRLPLPLEVGAPRVNRKEARRQLGIDEQALVLITAASAYKFETARQEHIALPIAEVLSKKREAIMIAIGPRDIGPWRSARIRTGGRISAVGIKQNLSAYLQAADIYIDSSPFTSLTSALEAGAAALPIVRYTSPFFTASTFQPDDEALVGRIATTRSHEEFKRAIHELLVDGEQRRVMGSRLSSSISEVHSTDAWPKYLPYVYEAAEKSGLASRPISPPKRIEEYDAQLISLQAVTDGDTSWRRPPMLSSMVGTRSSRLVLDARAAYAMRSSLKNITGARLARKLARASAKESNAQ